MTDERKRIGALYLDLSQLRKDITEANTMLKSLGEGFSLNMGETLRAQIRETFGGASEAAKSAGSLNREITALRTDKLEKLHQVFKGTSDAIRSAGKDAKAFNAAYNSLARSVRNVTQAQGACEFIMSRGVKSAADLKDAYRVLSDYMGREMNADNLSQALEMISYDGDTAARTLTELIGALNGLDGVNIDASRWEAELAGLSTSADDTVAHLAGVALELMRLSGSYMTVGADGKLNVIYGTAGDYLPPSAAGAPARRGGGRAKKDKDKQGMSEIERMLDLMSQLDKIQAHKRNLMGLAQEFHGNKGELQGVILYMEKEKKAILENTATLEANVAKIETYIASQQKLVDKMSKADEEYEQAAKDLKALQDTHMSYSEALLKNRTDIDKLNDAIKEQRNIIRDMEIELRNTILQAIRDREELNGRMLQGTIETENTILDLIKRRHEIERDEILRNCELKVKAWEDEKKQLSEQLRLRKEMAKEEEKEKKLAELEAKMARIAVDPTREKERLALQEEISKLREEMAWDLAEKEVKAQQDAIDGQIENTQDYMEYVRNYYEELFEHPKMLIDEMKEIMKQTDEEIIEWLMDNSEVYREATEATREDMTNGWRDMLMDMHGELKLYWDEVETIIQGGDDAIIAFLKQHSADYKEAGKLQAEAYVDEWQKQLDNLKAAYKKVSDEINAANYALVEAGTGTGSGSSSGGGGGGGGTKPKTETTYQYGYKNKTGGWVSVGANKDQAVAFRDAQNAAKGYWNTYAGEYGVSEVMKMLSSATADNPGSYIKKYAKGGIADFTGPAWLDGSLTSPERILSPYQTRLFDDMVKALQGIDRIQLPAMPGITVPDVGGEGYSFYGDIVLNVNQLETDADYEEVGEKIMAAMVSKSSRGKAVGGIRSGF